MSFDDLLKKADKDGDGKVSQAEFPDDVDFFRRPEATGLPGTALKMKIAFRMIDADGDGFVTREEWDGFLKKAREEMAKRDHGLVAVKPGGQGDVSETHVAWRERRSLPEVPSPLYYQGRLYLVRDGGLATCLDAKTGKVLFRERLGATGAYFASPVAGDGKVYAVSRDGVVTVLAAGDRLQVLARNDLREPVAATPALAGGKVYVRTERHLYAFGE
jgi:outer membrane protein assembly factor BamB